MGFSFTIGDILEIINKIDAFREKYRSGSDMTKDDLALTYELLMEYKESLLSKKVE